MSRCSCTEPKELRITGEVAETYPNSNAIGPGAKTARVRCGECGGKVGRIGSDVLTRLFKIPYDEIEAGRCLCESERRTITVDLI
jgi:hypothetical protein